MATGEAPRPRLPHQPNLFRLDTKDPAPIVTRNNPDIPTEKPDVTMNNAERFRFFNNVERVVQFNDHRFCLLTPNESTGCQNIADVSFGLAGAHELSIVLDFDFKLTEEEQREAILIQDEHGGVLGKYHPKHKILHVDHHYEALLDDRKAKYSTEHDNHSDPRESTTALLWSLLTRLEDPSRLTFSDANGEVDFDIALDGIMQALNGWHFTTYVNHTDNDGLEAMLLLNAHLSGLLKNNPRKAMLLVKTALNVDHWQDSADPDVIKLQARVKALEKDRDLLNLLRIGGNTVFPEVFTDAPEVLRNDFDVKLAEYEEIRRKSIGFAEVALGNSHAGVHYVEIQGTVDTALVYGEFARQYELKHPDEPIPTMVMVRKSKNKAKDVNGNELPGDLVNFWVRSRSQNLTEVEAALLLWYGIAGRSGAGGSSRQKFELLGEDNMLATSSNGGSANEGYYVAPGKLDRVLENLAKLLAGELDKIGEADFVKRHFRDRNIANLKINVADDISKNYSNTSEVRRVKVTYLDGHGQQQEEHFIVNKISHEKLSKEKIAKIIAQNRAGHYVDAIHAPVALEWLSSTKHSLALYRELAACPDYSSETWKKIHDMWKSWQGITQKEFDILGNDLPQFSVSDYEAELAKKENEAEKLGLEVPKQQVSVESFGAGFIHNHLSIPNLLYDSEEGEIYITDFEKSRIGDPTEDMAHFLVGFSINNLPEALRLLAGDEIAGLPNLRFFIYRKSLEQMIYNHEKATEVGQDPAEVDLCNAKIAYFKQFIEYFFAAEDSKTQARSTLQTLNSDMAAKMKARRGDKAYYDNLKKYGVTPNLN